jgi:hypothetical protein
MLEVNRLVLETIEPRVDGVVDSGCEIIGRVAVGPDGHEAEVTPATRVPRAHRLVLGDHSKVQISA